MNRTLPATFILCVAGNVQVRAGDPPWLPVHQYDFASGTQGWQMVAFPYFHEVSPTRSTVPWDSGFGNPNAIVFMTPGPGSLRAGDVYLDTGVAAPTGYAGSLLWAYDPLSDPSAYTSFRFSTYVRQSSLDEQWSIVLNCGTESLYSTYTASANQLNKWVDHRVPLNEAHWYLASTDAHPTRAQFVSLIQHVTALYLRTEYNLAGPDDTNVDNVQIPRHFLPGDCAIDGNVDFQDLLGLAQNYGGTFPNWTPDDTWTLGDFNGDGAVNFPDLLALAVNYNRSVNGSVAAPSARASVPEPAIATGLAVASCVLARPRRRRAFRS